MASSREGAGVVRVCPAGDFDIAVFTLYFAGHAAVFDETLYIAPIDTILGRIPASAIGFPDILRTTTGARPKQANFIIGAKQRFSAACFNVCIVLENFARFIIHHK